MLTNNAWNYPTYPNTGTSFGGYNALGSANYGWNNAIINIAFGGNCSLEKGEYYRITHYVNNPICGLDSTTMVFNQYGPIGSPKLIAGGNNAEEETVIAGTNSFNIYPNPSNGIISLGYTVEENATVKVIITDMLGRAIKTANLLSNSTTTQLDLSDHENGIYFVNLFENNKLVKTEKLILNR